MVDISQMMQFDDLLKRKLDERVNQLSQGVGGQGFMPQTAPQPPGALNLQNQGQPTAPQENPATGVLDRLRAMNESDPRSVVGGINDLAQPFLRKLGPVGSGISKGVDFLEGIGDTMRGAAERGTLGAVAPRFQAGVNAAQERAMQEMQVKAMMQPKPQDSFRVLSLEEKERMGLDPAQAYRIDEATGKVEGIGSAGTNVQITNTGPIPKDFRLITDPETGEQRMEVIPGSETAREREKAAIQRENRESSVAREGNVITTEIDRAIASMQPDDGISLPDVGFGSGLASLYPRSDARKIEGNLKTIKASIGFNKLQSMREASPTGGALGQVSERELDFLNSIMGDVAQNQDPQVLEFNLNRLWNATQDIVHGPNGGPPRRMIRPPELPNSPLAPHGSLSFEGEQDAQSIIDNL